MSETNCDHCTGLACGDECDEKSHATTFGGIPVRVDLAIPENVVIVEQKGRLEGAIINLGNATTERTCETCGGDGIERCDNPDHGFIEAVSGEISRLGCPCCGHDPEHRMRGSKCPDCNGTGKKLCLIDQDVDECLEAFDKWHKRPLTKTDEQFSVNAGCYFDEDRAMATAFLGGWCSRPSRPMSAEVEKSIEILGENIGECDFVAAGWGTCIERKTDLCASCMDREALNVIVSALKEKV